MNESAATAMNAAPTSKRRDSRTTHPIGSPRPTAWPTMTAAADDTPSGTMKVSEARFSAT